LTIFNFLAVALLLNWLIWKLAEEYRRIQRNEARLALAVETPGAGVFDWNTVTGDLMWTPEAERAIGMPVGGMNRIEIWESRVVRQDAETIWQRQAEAVARKDDHYSFRYRLETQSGRWRTFEGTARCFYDDQGQLCRLVGINLDVTDREEQEAVLQERRAQLRSIFEFAPDAMILVDGDRTIREFNPAAEAMFGHPATEAIGMSITALLPEDRRFRSDYLSGFSEGEARDLLGKAVSLAALRKDGEYFPAELTIARTETRRGLFYVAFVRDVSERIDAEQRLDELRNEFAHMARLNAMGELAAGLAHELNQPLAAGANYLGTAQMIVEAESRNDDLADLLDRARNQSLRAGQIIRRLRDFVAKGSAAMSVENVERTIVDAIAIALIGKEGHSIKADFSVGEGAEEMIADRVQIQQVLVNLLRNAAEAMRDMPVEQRSITIVAEPADPDLVRFTVTDHGSGFSPEMLDKLFTPFLSTKGSGGMGIGMSICRRIIEAHGGQMNVANASGGGARVEFSVQRA
jgi:two-component system sensor kinase FixL